MKFLKWAKQLIRNHIARNCSSPDSRSRLSRWRSGKESTCQCRRHKRDEGSIPGWGRSPGVRNGNPLQYSFLENSTNGGACLATVHGLAKSWTRLSDWVCTHTHTQVQTPPGRVHYHLLSQSSDITPEILPSYVCLIQIGPGAPPSPGDSQNHPQGRGSAVHLSRACEKCRISGWIRSCILTRSLVIHLYQILRSPALELSWANNKLLLEFVIWLATHLLREHSVPLSGTSHTLPLQGQHLGINPGL